MQNYLVSAIVFGAIQRFIGVIQLMPDNPVAVVQEKCWIETYRYSFAI
ncbi:MAG: hypothetical protein Q7T96_16590 [Methylobacter sp.]|nr:hypothetical protein [Methylobacter sp.]